MSEVLDAAAHRREVRRKKILENADKRKEKILNAKASLSLDNENSDRTQLFSSDENTFPGQESSSYVNKEEKETIIIPQFVPQDLQSENFSATNSCADKEWGIDSIYSNENSFEEPFKNLMNNSNCSPVFNGWSSNFLNKLAEQRLPGEQPQNAFKWAIEHDFAPCFLASIVCFLITFQFGGLVSNSIIVPFFLWEVQYCISFPSEENSDQNSFIGSVILLCGINKDILSTYKCYSRLLKKLTGDFAFYFITIIIWHIVVGLPQSMESILEETMN